MRGKKILGATLAAVFVVSLAPPASALTIGFAGIFLPLPSACGGLGLLDDTVRVATEVFEEHECGDEVDVERGGVTVRAKLVDDCQSCAAGDVDLSPGAFLKIGRVAEGRVKVNWDFI